MANYGKQVIKTVATSIPLVGELMMLRVKKVSPHQRHLSNLLAYEPLLLGRWAYCRRPSRGSRLRRGLTSLLGRQVVRAKRSEVIQSMNHSRAGKG